MIKKRIGSITLALGLIIVGALLFAKNFTPLPVSNLYKYWPILLVGLGVEVLIYNIIYGRDNKDVSLGVDGLCIVFIVFVAVFGSAFGTFKMNNIHFFDGFDSVIEWSGKYKTEITENFKRENIGSDFSIKEIKIDNEFGTIDIMPSNSKNVSVSAEIKIKCNDEEKARAFSSEAITIKEGENIVIGVNMPNNSNEDFSRPYVKMTVYVPSDVEVLAENKFGRIEAKDINVKLSATANNGEIYVQNIGNDVSIKNSFGKIEVSNVSGDAIIINQHGEIDANNIDGDTSIENHFGRILAESIKGKLEAKNNNGQIDVTKVDSDAAISNSFGAIDIDDVNGDIVVSNNNGEIDVDDVSGNISIKNSFGKISCQSKSFENAQIYAKTNFGNIDCEERIEVKKSGSETVAKGETGSGEYKVEIINQNGDIDLDN